ncbi:putative disease resistance protein RGA3 [Hordeum vulgare]|nr:putative disease resistance protein RGA3 [Hordeum vulgare]
MGMDAVQDTTSLQAAIRWLAAHHLPSLSELDGWIRQAGLGGEVEGLSHEIEQVDGVVSAVNASSEIRNRSLARSLAALKELLYGRRRRGRRARLLQASSTISTEARHPVV